MPDVLMKEMKSIVPGAKTLLSVGSNTDRSLHVETVARAQWLDLRIFNFSASVVQKKRVSGSFSGVRCTGTSGPKLPCRTQAHNKNKSYLKTSENCKSNNDPMDQNSRKERPSCHFPSFILFMIYHDPHYIGQSLSRNPQLNTSEKIQMFSTFRKAIKCIYTLLPFCSPQDLGQWPQIEPIDISVNKDMNIHSNFDEQRSYTVFVNSGQETPRELWQNFRFSGIF